MIKIKGLSFKYRDSNEILSDINLEIKDNEFVTFVGKNGSGKTTLSLILSSFIEEYNGEVLFDDELVKDFSKNRKNFGIVFQNFDNQFFNSIVKKDIAFGLENQNLKRELIDEKINNILRELSIEHLIDKDINILSGGEKQLIALSSILVLNKKVLILDEITSMLDPKNRYIINKVIKELHQKRKLTIIQISHNYEDIINSDRIIELENGKIINDLMKKDFIKDESYIRKYK